jgi:hypothetical protein
MKKRAILLLMVMVSASGCYSLGRGVASRVVEHLEAQDTRQCSIIGTRFNGIASYFDEGGVVKVLMVHGIGTHRPGHSALISENIARALGLDIFSRARDFSIMNPQKPEQRLANLRIFTMRNADASRQVVFYELTWSEITAERKQVLDFDRSGEFSHRRASFNNTVKTFLNDVGPDPMIYLTDKENLILTATQQAICWMLASGEGVEIEDHSSAVCSVSSFSRLVNLERANIVFITHSLGSRIIMDALGDIVETLANDQIVTSHPALVAQLQEKVMTVFMLSNQMPLLQIGLPPPKVSRKIASHCRADGADHAARAFQKLEIVAVTDPNDLFSYAITQDFVDAYLDSRMCPAVTNININVADPIHAFGIEVVNPISAHGNYGSDDVVIEIVSHGNKRFLESAILSERCRMITIDE